MVPGPLGPRRRRVVAWTLATLSLVLAGCASTGLVGEIGPGKAALAPPRPSHSPARPVPGTGGSPVDPSVSLPAGASLVATATVASLPVYPWPGAANAGLNLASPDTNGAPLVLLVASVQGEWVQAYLPVRPNGAQGWVPRADVSLAEDDYRITVSLVNRQLDLLQGSTLVAQVSVAVGSPSSPTPVGTFFVTDVLQLTDPQNAYGPYALGLSAFSNTFSSFDGGPGQVAVHGTNEPWVIGGYASHGCVRLANADIARLAAVVPAGTPVVIGL